MKREGASLRIGLVGCGAIAKDHLKALGNNRNLKLVAVCDMNRDAAIRVAKEWNIDRFYTDFSEMLKDQQLSIVSILTPPQAHASLAIKAIEERVNVFVEKPLTIATGEAELILKSLKGSNMKLTVNYNWLLSNVMMKAISLIRNGKAGDVLGACITILHTKDDEMASNERHWSHKLPGGRFGEMLSHPVYLAQSILGNNLSVDRIIAEKRGGFQWMRYDELHALLQSPSGIANIYISFNAPRPEIRLDIFGTKEIMQMDLLNQTLVELKYRTLSKLDSALDCLYMSYELSCQTARNAFAYMSRSRGENALRMGYASLVSSMTEDIEPIVTPEMANSTVKIVDDICKQL